MIPAAAVEAAIATSTTWQQRGEEGRAAYRKRIETVLEAALPALREQFVAEQQEAAVAPAGSGFQAYITVVDDQGEGWTYREGDRTIDGPAEIPAVTTAGQPIPFSPNSVAQCVKLHQIQQGTYTPPERSPEEVSG